MKELCSYGCGKEAIIKFKNGKYCCSDSKNKCTALREKNSKGINKNGVWNKNLTKEIDNRVNKYAISGGETRRQQVIDGEYTVWNKGLDKYEPRVFNNMKNLIAETKKGNGTLQYNIDKYGEVEGTKKYIENNKLKSQTLTNYIKRYGEAEGTVKYEKYINNRKNYFSKISQELFFAIDNSKNSYFALKNKEFGLRDNNYYYFYDYVDTKSKKVIEFNGDDFHANPKIYESDNIPLNFINKTASEIWDFDRNKLNKIINKGYEVLIIWESDYKKNKNKVIDDCIKFLSSITL